MNKEKQQDKMEEFIIKLSGDAESIPDACLDLSSLLSISHDKILSYLMDYFSCGSQDYRVGAIRLLSFAKNIYLEKAIFLFQQSISRWGDEEKREAAIALIKIFDMNSFDKLYKLLFFFHDLHKSADAPEIKIFIKQSIEELWRREKVLKKHESIGPSFYRKGNRLYEDQEFEKAEFFLGGFCVH